MSKLSSYANDWQNSQIEVSEFITPDDGKYRVIIDEIAYSEQDKDGNETYPTFIYTFTITDGNCKGLRFRRYSAIRNEKSAGFIKGDLQKLGIPIPANPEELPALFISARGSVIDVNVKTKEINGKPYKDVYIERLIGKQQPAPQPQRQAPQQYPQQSAPYQQPRQMTDARANPPQGFYQQTQQYPQPQPQPQAFGAGYNQNDEIPF